MSHHRLHIPPATRYWLTDSGLETTLIFVDGYELPAFAAFSLLDSDTGRERLRRYFEDHIALAIEAGTGIVLETPTWRASADWGASLGYDAVRLDVINRQAVAELDTLRQQHATPSTPILVSGNIGPRGDGYRADSRMSVDEARAYHAPQIASFADSPADRVAAFTLNYIEEGIGIALAARDAGIPAVLSFTLETDGRLPSGMGLGDAIRATDDATGGSVEHYMINCAHPEHFQHVLDPAEDWPARIGGIRANASRLSHAELDAATELDAGDPSELAMAYRALAQRLPRLAVVGGCCGTDCRHVAAIRDQLLS